MAGTLLPASVEHTEASLPVCFHAEVGQTDASFVRLQVAEVKTTDALKRMDFETSVAPTEASKYNSLTGLGIYERVGSCQVEVVPVSHWEAVNLSL
jgi:hypothetical protein